MDQDNSPSTHCNKGFRVLPADEAEEMSASVAAHRAKVRSKIRS